MDELYRFLNSWVAHIYGDLDEEALKLRGFELIQHDTEWANNRTSSKVIIAAMLTTVAVISHQSRTAPISAMRLASTRENLGR